VSRFGVRHENHVGLVDGLPAGDGRAVEHDAIGNMSSSTWLTSMVTCCILPRGSVKRTSTNFTSLSLMDFKTSAAVVMLPQKSWCQSKVSELRCVKNNQSDYKVCRRVEFRCLILPVATSMVGLRLILLRDELPLEMRMMTPISFQLGGLL
jgi:hypothetical protein